MSMAHSISEKKALRLVAVLMLALLVALPVSSAYLNVNIDMTEHVQDRSCYCHGAEPEVGVDIEIDVPLQVPFTPSNDSVRVGIGIIGEPLNLTGFGLFLNASEDASGVKWTKQFSNDTVEESNGEIAGLIKVNQTSIWTVGKIEDPWFNLSFIPGQTDQDIVLSVAGMRADENGNETGDYWNVAERTIKVRKQHMVNLTVGVTNNENVIVSEVLVDFYIDGDYIGNDTINNIAPQNSINASVQWDTTFKKDGKYTLRADIDPDDQVTETDKSNNEVTQTIWLGGPPEEDDLTLYYGLGSMAVGTVIVVAIFWLWRRRQYRF